MFTKMQNLFGKPELADDEENQQALLIHGLLLAMIGLNSLYTLVIGLFRDGNEAVLLTNTFLILLHIILLAVLRRGSLQYTIMGIICTSWAFLTVAIIGNIGASNQVYFPAFIVIILLAGWLLDSRYSLAIALLSSAVGWFHIESDGFLSGDVWIWESMTIIFLIVVCITHFSHGLLQRTLDRLRQQEQALKQMNADLQAQIATNAQNEEERRRSETQYRRLLAISPVAMVIGDRETFDVLYANARSMSIFGVKQPKEMLGDTMRRRISAETRNQLKAYAQAWSEDQALKPIEYQFRGADNMIKDLEIVSIPIDFEGRPAILSALHDITLMKQSETRYRLLLENLPVAVMVATVSEKQIIYANPSAVNMLGAEHIDNLLGLPFNTFVIEDNRAMSEARIELLETETELPPLEYRYRRLDGVQITVEITTIRTIYQEQEVFLSAFTDVTDRVEVQKQQFEMERRRLAIAEETKTFMMKDTFITAISHEFRTPLTIINSSKDLLERYYDRMDETKRANHFQKMGEQVAYMVSLLDDILFLSQTNAGIIEFNPNFVHLESLCAEAFTDFKTDHMAGLHELIYTQTSTADEPFFMLQEDLIRKTIHRILDNAVKYSPNGGTVTLSLDITPEQAMIKISDEGIGIAEDDIKNLYDPFQRGQNNTEVSSVGLGLAIIKQIMDTHKGSISCESTLNQGTTFTLTFPAPR